MDFEVAQVLFCQLGYDKDWKITKKQKQNKNSKINTVIIKLNSYLYNIIYYVYNIILMNN